MLRISNILWKSLYRSSCKILTAKFATRKNMQGIKCPKEINPPEREWRMGQELPGWKEQGMSNYLKFKKKVGGSQRELRQWKWSIVLPNNFQHIWSNGLNLYRLTLLNLTFWKQAGSLLPLARHYFLKDQLSSNVNLFPRKTAQRKNYNVEFFQSFHVNLLHVWNSIKTHQLKRLIYFL